MSRLLRETEELLYLRDYLHGQSESFSDWETDESGNLKYSSIVHEAEHYALYEISVEYSINKKTGEVKYIGFDI